MAKTNVIKLKEIVKQHSAKKIGRTMVDVQTANAILTVRKNLKPSNRAKYTRIINSDVKTAGNMAWRLLG